jgi:hypothetical protein
MRGSRKELETLKRTESTMDRARQRLEANRHQLAEIGVKAQPSWKGR